VSYQITEEQEQLRDLLRELLVSRARPRDAFDGGPALDGPVWSHLQDLGLVGIFVSEHLGGSGGSLFDQTLVAEQIGAAVAAIPVTTSSLAALVLGELGTEQAGALLGRLGGAGQVVLAAVSASRGLDLGVTARSTDEGWALDGAVSDLLEAAAATTLIVPATVEGAHGWFEVEIGGAGVERRDQPSLDPTQRVAGVVLDGAPARLLGRTPPGSDLADRVLRLGWVLLAAQAMGAAEQALQRTVRYATERVAFGQPIGRFQAVKHRAAEMLLDVENARSAAYNAGWSLDADRADATLSAHLAKAVATENAVTVVHAAIQLHGGIGFTWEHDLHLFLRRAKACQLVLGNPTEHFEAIAGALLDDRLLAAGAQ
jgi:alkylation response protein AidB-like acyl-CoA dehydrogenase